jgi:hypothetical protein
MPNRQACVLTHARDPERVRWAVGGLLLCYGHLLRLADDLADLPGLYRRLVEQHNPGGGTGPKTSGSRDLGLRYNPKIAGARGEIYTALAGWARSIAEEAGWTLPDDDLGAIAGWLLGPRGTRLRWAAGQAWADEYAVDITRVHREAWPLAYPNGQHRVDVGPCTRGLSCDVETRAEQCCAGTLRATLHDADDLLPAELVCDECAWPVPPREWVTLGRRLGRTTPQLTAAQLANLWSVPIKTVQRWAVKDAWPHDRHRPARYDAVAAQISHDHNRSAALTKVSDVRQADAEVEAVSVAS